MKKLNKKQVATVNTIEAQAYCMCTSCGGYCTCYGQPDNVWQSVDFDNKWSSEMSSYNRSVN